MKPAYRLLRASDVMDRTAFSRTHLYSLIRKGEFPKPRNLGSNCSRWLESEVDAWIAEKAGVSETI